MTDRQLIDRHLVDASPEAPAEIVRRHIDRTDELTTAVKAGQFPNLQTFQNTVAAALQRPAPSN